MDDGPGVGVVALEGDVLGEEVGVQREVDDQVGEGDEEGAEEATRAEGLRTEDAEDGVSVVAEADEFED